MRKERLFLSMGRSTTAWGGNAVKNTVWNGDQDHGRKSPKGQTEHDDDRPASGTTLLTEPDSLTFPKSRLDEFSGTPKTVLKHLKHE